MVGEVPVGKDEASGRSMNEADRRGYLRRSFAVLAVVMLIAGCAMQRPAENRAVIPFEEPFDPIEPVNRVIFDFNEVLDELIGRPVGKLYRAILPEMVRDSVRNFLRNLGTPVVLANDILQGEEERAQTTLTRFFINTTIGVGGLADVASDMGYAYHREDFGQTLAVYGAGEGFYLVLPILGPSTLRDTTGAVVDFFLNPLNYVAPAFDAEAWLAAQRALDGVDMRSRNIDTLDELKRNSLDFYSLIRSIYLQRRQYDIRNGRLADESPAAPLSQREVEESRAEGKK